MSEQAAAPEAVTPDPEKQQGDPADGLGDAGKKALAAEREARKAAEKSAAEFAERLKKLETANLSELERAQREAAEARATLEQITKQNLRNSVALAKGVPADLVDFLNGDTEDEIAAKADVLLARLSTPTSPRPDPSQGARGDALALNSDGLEQALRDKLGI